MDEVALDLDPAMVDNMRREADKHGFDDLDGYVQWLLERRDTVLNEYDAWDDPPGVADPEEDLAQSSSPSLDDGDASDWETLDEEAEAGDAGGDGGDDTAEADDEEVELPEDDGADDDDVAAALEEIELDDEE